MLGFLRLANWTALVALAALLVFSGSCRSKGNQATPAKARLAASSTRGVADASASPPSSSATPALAGSSQADVVSKASVVYDAGAPVVVEGKVDGAALRVLSDDDIER